MLEIRIHGRGGQGSVTAAQILAISAFHDGKQSQAFPRFGVERRGAPVEAFCRIDDTPVHVRSQVYNPDLVLILEPSLLEAVDVTAGLKKGSNIIINTSKPIAGNKLANFKVFNVDASQVALEIFKADIVNTAILGAFAKVTGIVSLKAINKAIDERFEGRPRIIEMNKEAVRRVYEQVN
ncbi:pyruvate ferredoxin oxidoreductase subunit gamma [Candidatus Woesearchaeota archaeon]|nr:pyruvate ferredoxin oxidoreductase subunit gamma [Candidatus Woesearchaeota archaeon]